MHLCSALRVENNPCRDAGRLISVLDGEGVFCRLCGGLDRRKYDAPYAEITALAGVKRKGDPIRYRVYFRYKRTRAEGYSEALALTHRIADNAAMTAENSSLLVNKVALLALSDAGFDKGGVIIVGDKAYLLAVGSVQEIKFFSRVFSLTSSLVISDKGKMRCESTLWESPQSI